MRLSGIAGSVRARKFIRLSFEAQPGAWSFALSLLALSPFSAKAQSAADAPKLSGTICAPASLDAVEVTAERRMEPVREVSMQVDVLPAERLRQSGAQKLNDYIPEDPGVQFQSIGGTGLGQLSIRGVTTGTQTGPTVGVYVDDVAIGSSTVYGTAAQLAFDMGLQDLDHVEILRGPQGTLYGAGAMGGVLKYVSQSPGFDHFEADLGAGTSFTQRGGVNTTVHAVANLPIGSGFGALRLSGFTDHDGAYVDATGPRAGNNVAHGDTSGGRASLVLVPGHDWVLKFNAMLQNINRHGQDFVDYNVSAQPAFGDLKRQLFADEPFHQTVNLFSAEMEYRLGWARLNAISSYQSMRTRNIADVTPTFGPIFAAGGLTLDTVTTPNDFYTSKYSEELRLTSHADQALEWLAGLYFTHEGSSLRQGIDGTSSGAQLALEDVHIPTTYQEYAGYGDVTWGLFKDVSFTGGVRIAHNAQNYSESTSGLLVKTPTITPGSSSDTSTTFLATIKYKLTSEGDVYLRTASGYRPGGPNDELVDPVTRQPVAGKTTFDPDKLYSYEGGYKGDFLRRRLSLQAAVYDIYWKHIQQLGSVDGVNQIINAGDARIKGAEFSSTVRPVENLELSASAAYIEAQLRTGSPGVGSEAGNDLPNTPKYSATVAVNYSYRILGYQTYSGIVERYIGKRQSSFEDDKPAPDFRLPAYAVTDAQSGVDFRGAQVSLYMRNVFDRRGLLGAQTSFVPLGGTVQATVLQPRTVGLEANLSF